MSNSGIYKVTLNGATIRPATSVKAVLHDDTRSSLEKLINEYNLSSLYPTSGEGASDKYTLEGALTLLGATLSSQNRRLGVELKFKNQTGDLEHYIYTGKGDFSDKGSWKKVGEGGSGITDYNSLTGKPRIAGVELVGDKSLNDLGIQAKGDYITSAVNNLVNYYKKQETYSKTEVNDLISRITTGLVIEVVESLPDQGDSKKIYLLRKAPTKKRAASSGNSFDEYIWLASDSKYELIGSTTIDLSQYYTKDESDGKFALKTDISDMLTKTEASQTYAQKTEISGFIKTTDADKKYQTKGDYATKSELGNKADKISKQQVSGATPTQALSPNKFYVFGEVTTLTVTLASEISGIYNEYLFQFTSGATATTLNVPSSVKWIGDKTIEKNKTYIVSIVGNLAVLGGA